MAPSALTSAERSMCESHSRNGSSTAMLADTTLGRRPETSMTNAAARRRVAESRASPCAMRPNSRSSSGAAAGVYTLEAGVPHSCAASAATPPMWSCATTPASSDAVTDDRQDWKRCTVSAISCARRVWGCGGVVSNNV